MILITSLGNFSGVWILIALYEAINENTTLAMTLMAGIVIDVMLCNGLLKPLFKRNRPFVNHDEIKVLIGKPKDYSFPSGHASSAFMSATILYLGGSGLWILAVTLAILVGFSRMYHYVHYPSDVLVGTIVGTVFGFITYHTLALFL